MEKDIIIGFNNVYEEYDVEISVDGKSSREKFLALQDINLAIEKEECVAIIGPNGAGKSTILRLIAGLIKPDRGNIMVIGRIGSLLDLGAGFHLELTGRDNLFLNASIYNLGKDMINSRFEEIVKFADIGKFVDAPLKCYSQGMYVRLAFSLAINVNPDILLIDDCLAVGDEGFQVKCIDKVLELKENGVTIIFVTHDINLAKEVCDRGIYIRNGRIVKDGLINEAVAAYTKPLNIDMKIYKYLGFKKQEEMRIREEERKRQEEQWQMQRKQEEVRIREEERKRQEEQWQMQRKQEEAHIREEERKRQEEQWQMQRKQEEARIREEERKRQEEQWQMQRKEKEDKRKERDKREEWKRHIENGRVSLRFDFGRIGIYYDSVELTAASGLCTFLSIENIEYNSRNAIWRLEKISDNEWACYLKWRKPLSVIQIWKIRIIDNGVINLEVILQTRGNKTVRNERIELGLLGQFQPAGIDARNNKAAVLNIKGRPDLSFVSLEERQISGCSANITGGPSLYFLTVHKNAPPVAATNKVRYSCFKGFISIESANSAVSPRVSVVHTIKDGGLKIIFDEGHIDLLWHDKKLTKCLGMYSSIYSKGVWYDSTQAIWEIKEASERALAIEGFWPWLPVSQVWKLSFDKGNSLVWDARMQVYEDVSISIQEVALMLSEAYTQWFAGSGSGEFPDEYTRDDVFRYCLWSHAADGDISVKMKSQILPALSFHPDALEHYKIVLENSAHIYNVESRLLHCMRLNKDSHSRITRGTYSLFKGHLTIRREKR